MNNILEIKNLIKTYGKDGFKAVDGISFSVKGGEILGLLGPNGAGKTTTIDMILGVVEPTSGSIFIMDKDLKKNRSEVLEKVNFTAVSTSIPGNLTVWENLFIFGMLYGIKNIRYRINEVVRQFDLDRFLNSSVGLLSAGEQTRVNLAKAVLNNPKLILLDEPTASLDPHIALMVRDMIVDYVRKNNAAVLWTSHNMQEVETVCDRVLFVSRGKIITEGDPRKISAQYGKKNLEELFISIAKEPLAFYGE